MELSQEQLQLIRSLDDGSLYADPEVVSQLFRYPDMYGARLLISRNPQGQPDGYLPVGHFYADGTLSYIAAMPNSPAVSPTYTPGAARILRHMRAPYFDSDVVPAPGTPAHLQVRTASAYGLPLTEYLHTLSTKRRKDFRRKLKIARQYEMVKGDLADLRKAEDWLRAIWDSRGTAFGDTPYSAYLDYTLAWLAALDRSPRATVHIKRYRINYFTVGINCYVTHEYQGRMHCDDYLTWYDPAQASGLGIVSAINNLTHPQHQGYRYNLGNPGTHKAHAHHAYKFDLLPPELRLTQSVLQLV